MILARPPFYAAKIRNFCLTNPVATVFVVVLFPMACVWSHLVLAIFYFAPFSTGRGHAESNLSRQVSQGFWNEANVPSQTLPESPVAPTSNALHVVLNDVSNASLLASTSASQLKDSSTDRSLSEILPKETTLASSSSLPGFEEVPSATLHADQTQLLALWSTYLPPDIRESNDLPTGLPAPSELSSYMAG